MKKEILFVLLNDFADWEGAYIAPNLNAGVEPGSESKYIVKTVSITKEPVASIGGFKVLPDYGINDIPSDYAGIVLIGGMSWFSADAELIVPLVKDAIEKKRLVAGICNASVFLGMHGFLNEVNHTSNGLDYLKQFAEPSYTSESLYMNEPAVRSGNIVTANGFAALEFSREILYALEADSPNKIERSYRMNKTGVWEDPTQKMSIFQLTENKKQHLDLLLLADEQESMIDRYLERGDMFVLNDDGIKAICVITDEGDGVCELKNIAVTPKSQRQGYGKRLIKHLLAHYSGKYHQMMVGTGDVPSSIGFYKSCGFEHSHRIENFFTDNYDHQMFEDGVLLKDMIYLKQDI